MLENPAAKWSPASRSSYPRGSERILFVDDEELLVEVGVEMLKDLGYDAVGTTRASQALEMFKARPDGFDLLITDMTMPGMTGDQLAAADVEPPIRYPGNYLYRVQQADLLGSGFIIRHPRAFNETGHCSGTLPNYP